MGFLTGLNTALGIGQAGLELFGKKGLRKSQKDDYRFQLRAQAKEQRWQIERLARHQPAWIRKGAEDAGFHPTLFTGGAGQPVGQGSAQIMSGRKLNNLAAASDTLLEVEALQSQRSQLELDRQRLERLAQDRKLKPAETGIQQRSRPNAPNATSDSGQAGTGNGVGAAGDIGDGDNPRPDTLPGGEPAPTTPVNVGGGWLKQNPFYSNAEEWEARYGEPGDWLGGVVTGVADATYNAYLANKWAGNKIARGFDSVFGAIDKSARKKAKPKPKKKTPPKWGTREWQDHMRALYP